MVKFLVKLKNFVQLENKSLFLQNRLTNSDTENAKSMSTNFIIAFFIAIIYPIFWIFYLSLPRLQRLETNINIYEILEKLNINTIITIFFMFYYFFPIIFPLIIFLIKKFKNIKEFLWEYTEALFYNVHLKLLSSNFYFKICEYIYKGFFIFHDIFAGNPGATWNNQRNNSFMRKIYSHLYFGYAKICFIIIIFSLVFLEIILNKGDIFYGLYLLFLSPVILSLFKNFISFGEGDFIKDVCYVDYKNFNFGSPRFPRKFWLYMSSPEKSFGFLLNMSPQLINILTKHLALNMIMIEKSKIFYNFEILLRAWGLRYIPRTKVKIPSGDFVIPGYYKYIGNPKEWSFRIAAKYKQTRGIRWFHTTPILLYPLPEKIHPLTIHFIKNNVYALLALTNHPSSNYNDIIKICAKKKFPSPQELYNYYDSNLIKIPNTNTTLVETLETNFVMQFKSLTDNKVIIGTYKQMKNFIINNQLLTMQMRPDMVSVWSYQSFFSFRGFLGIDQKHKMPTLYGRNQAISRPVENYSDLLEEYKKKLMEKFPVTESQINALNDLKSSQFDSKEHIHIWAKSLDKFPDKWKPPLLLDKTFDESNLNEAALELIRKGEATIVHISDTLYTLNVPEVGSFDDEALDTFYKSHLQKMLFEDKYMENENVHTSNGNVNPLDVD